MGCRFADRQLQKQQEAETKGINWMDIEYEDIPMSCGRTCKGCPEYYDTGETEHADKISDCDICPRCHKELTDDEIITVYESVPYGSTSASYPVVIGMNCSRCGYKEDW